MKDTITPEMSTKRSRLSAHEQGAELLEAAVRESMVPVGTNGHIATVPQARRVGILDRLFEDREDRRHREALKATANTAEEVIYGLSAESTIANATVAAGLETERGYEETIRAHADSPMALTAAPIYVQIARTNFTAGVSSLVSAGIQNIVRKINDR